MNAEVALPTSAEIDRRLRTVTELRNLCLSLGRARTAANLPDLPLEEKSGSVYLDKISGGFTTPRSAVVDAFDDCAPKTRVPGQQK